MENTAKKKEYRRIRIRGKRYTFHRIQWECHHGPIPDGMVIHHIDGNHRNNDIDNLRMMKREDHTRLHLAVYPQIKTCLQCGDQYKPTGNKGGRKYCTHSCFSKALSESMLIHPRVKDCICCGEQFEMKNNRGTRKFCSRSCAAKTQWAKFRGESL